MRILKLTSKTEAGLLKLRQAHDREAYRVASRIIADVQRRGDRALAEWSKKLDGVDLSKSGLWITKKEMAAAVSRVDRKFVHAVEHAAQNVRRVAEGQLPKDWTLEVEPGVCIRQLVRPLDSIGCYIPGGRFALLSTLVMTAVPAQVASVPDSLRGAIEALQADHSFLLRGDVFNESFIANWIDMKQKEYDALRLRPHPYEFAMYYDV